MPQAAISQDQIERFQESLPRVRHYGDAKLKLEVRHLRLVDSKQRAEDDEAEDVEKDDEGERAAEDLGTIVGVASTFEEPENYDCYGTVFGRNCYDEAIKMHEDGERLIKVLWQHGRLSPMGMTTYIEALDDGLHVEGEPNELDPLNASRMSYIEKGIVDELSVGWHGKGARYEVIPDIKDDWGWPVIRYTNIPLKEWSPVTFGANENTWSEVKREARALATATERSAGRLPGQIHTLAITLLADANQRAAEAADGKRPVLDLVELHLARQAMDTIRQALALAGVETERQAPRRREGELANPSRARLALDFFCGIRGERLSSLLEQQLCGRTDGVAAGEVLSEMVRAQGGDLTMVDAAKRALSPVIDWPTHARLEGIASALDLPTSDVIDAATADGARYTDVQTSTSTTPDDEDAALEALAAQLTTIERQIAAQREERG